MVAILMNIINNFHTVRRRLSQTLNPDKDPEEGKADIVEVIETTPDGVIANFPVRKPLEV